MTDHSDEPAPLPPAPPGAAWAPLSAAGPAEPAAAVSGFGLQASDQAGAPPALKPETCGLKPAPPAPVQPDAAPAPAESAAFDWDAWYSAGLEHTAHWYDRAQSPARRRRDFWYLQAGGCGYLLAAAGVGGATGNVWYALGTFIAVTLAASLCYHRGAPPHPGE